MIYIVDYLLGGGPTIYIVQVLDPTERERESRGFLEFIYFKSCCPLYTLLLKGEGPSIIPFISFVAYGQYGIYFGSLASVLYHFGVVYVGLKLI